MIDKLTEFLGWKLASSPSGTLITIQQLFAIAFLLIVGYLMLHSSVGRHRAGYRRISGIDTQQLPDGPRTIAEYPHKLFSDQWQGQGAKR